MTALDLANQATAHIERFVKSTASPTARLYAVASIAALQDARRIFADRAAPEPVRHERSRPHIERVLIKLRRARHARDNAGEVSADLDNAWLAVRDLDRLTAAWGSRERRA